MQNRGKKHLHTVNSHTEHSGWCVIPENFCHVSLSRKAPEWLRMFFYMPQSCSLVFKQDLMFGQRSVAMNGFLAHGYPIAGLMP